MSSKVVTQTEMPPAVTEFLGTVVGDQPRSYAVRYWKWIACGAHKPVADFRVPPNEQRRIERTVRKLVAESK